MKRSISFFGIFLFALAVLWSVNGKEVCAKTGASISIAWPFVGESPSLWYGDEGEKTAGGTVPTRCGPRNSHSGAEYYARDLNRNDGNDYGKPIGAGISGRIVVAGWQSGYGHTVVIYDASKHVAVRYAHMKSVSVSINQTVSLRQLIGHLGDSGNAEGMPHLHIVAFENINDNYGNPIIPTLCDSDYYACAIYFFC